MRPKPYRDRFTLISCVRINESIREFNCFFLVAAVVVVVVVMAYLLVFQLCRLSAFAVALSVTHSVIGFLDLSIRTQAFSISFTPSRSQAITYHSLTLRCNKTMQVSIGPRHSSITVRVSLRPSLSPSLPLPSSFAGTNRQQQEQKREEEKKRRRTKRVKKRKHYYIIVKMIIPIIISQFTTKYLMVSVFFLLFRVVCLLLYICLMVPLIDAIILMFQYPLHTSNVHVYLFIGWKSVHLVARRLSPPVPMEHLFEMAR